MMMTLLFLSALHITPGDGESRDMKLNATCRQAAWERRDLIFSWDGAAASGETGRAFSYMACPWMLIVTAYKLLIEDRAG